MKLYEFQGKALFNKGGIKTPEGTVIHSTAEIPDKTYAVSYPAMVKAQVLAGGRGKAGGVKRAMNPQAAAGFTGQLLGADLKDCKIDAILIEECVPFVEEYYLSITLDSASRMPVVIFSKHGGVDIEEVAATQPERIAKVSIDPLIGLQDFYFEAIFRKAELAEPEIKKRIKEVITSLYALFNDYDCMLVEINPLMKLQDGSIIAADAKVDIDDSGVYRHPDLVVWREEMAVGELIKQAKAVNFLYIDCEPDGTVGVISNGSGMIMSCVDWITKQGGKVACALDLGGGATADRVAEGIRILAQNPSVKAILISIFGGITRCDEIAGGIIKAVEKIPVPIVAKLDGTNKEAGMKLLVDANRTDITIGYSIKEAAEKVLKAQN
ncbi:ADP-forming succinate--CoA ligase subunit beta [Sporomusa termitida]|uniref:Succinate--CoA ligase [GDP-forming] subunit beta n=1 Tax=Sporomusa termitida TaxID=2377 RepID=A0A517DVZ7_9FIRM|nr:ADP-forming succinate--CoA ligase subunit beta [Sporomusa termitida]QDR81539.1 Succinate--CoA ligase [GDP-forming] subunit beta [Sporomusa termitida]